MRDDLVKEICWLRETVAEHADELAQMTDAQLRDALDKVRERKDAFEFRIELLETETRLRQIRAALDGKETL